MEKKNNWNVSYSSILFFEQALIGHKKVHSFERTEDIYFTIQKDDFSIIKVVLVDRYTLGIADIYRAIEEFHNFDYIVTCGEWNGYTPEAKQWGLENQKGVFIPSEFFAALYKKDFWNYAKKDKDGKPIYCYRIT